MKAYQCHDLPQEMNKEGYEYCMGIVKQAISASKE